MENKQEINISIITSLFRPANYLDSFLHYLSKINNLDECELIIIHNDPLTEDLRLINDFCSKKIVDIVQISVSRENLYASWNRGIKIAKGNFISIWNVDDIRNPDSLSSQKKALENSKAVMCYGDYYATDKYGLYKKLFYQYANNYSRLKKRANQAHVIGCFPMWKKYIHHEIGYFDEQFKLVGDWEFQMRTVRNFNLVKASTELGFCLIDKPHRLSSNRHLQYKEQTVVWLRFKLYNKILIHYLPQIKEFNTNKILSNGLWQCVSTTLPRRKFTIVKSLNYISQLPFNYFFWGIKRIIGRVKYFF